MFKIWANLSPLVGIAILAGIAWFVLYVIITAVFEEILGGVISRITLKKREKEAKEDIYIY
jgi:hypothetical protein